jgi:hypothetical protein
MKFFHIALSALAFLLICPDGAFNVRADGPSASNVVMTYTYYAEVESVGETTAVATTLEANATALLQAFIKATTGYSYVAGGANYTTLSGIKYCPKTCKTTSSTKCRNLGCAVCLGCKRRRNLRSLQKKTTTDYLPKITKEAALLVEIATNAALAPLCFGTPGCSLSMVLLMDNYNGTSTRLSQDRLWATTAVKNNGDGSGSTNYRYKQGQLKVYPTPDQVNGNADLDAQL